MVPLVQDQRGGMNGWLKRIVRLLVEQVSVHFTDGLAADFARLNRATFGLSH